MSTQLVIEMKLNKLILAALFLPLPVSLWALDVITVDDSFQKKVIGRNIEYHIEEKDKKLEINDIVKEKKWVRSKTDTINFGFTDAVYWFRFAIDNAGEGPMNLFFDVSYPLLHYIDFYLPGKTEYTHIQTGNMYPFYERKIEDKNFVFQLKEGPGTHVYYMRIQTKSSLNFVPSLMSQSSYFNKIQTQLPVIWIYYGLMLIMLVYNFFIFIASRDRSYFMYMLFISSYILMQMTLNGYSFQYLWPNAIWWACNSLPFFISTSVVLAAVFMRDVIGTRTQFRTVDRILLFAVILPGTVSAIASLLLPYKWAIQIATALVGILAVIIILCVIYTMIRNSRPARFVTIGFMGLVVGILLYVLKTFGLLPEMFITEWGVQIGSSMVIILLSLALADKINVMRNEMKGLLTEQRINEKQVRERAGYLEGIVSTATGLTDEFIKVSSQLQEITNRFSNLSMEQASTSEEMSSTFEELLGSVENIYHYTVTQKGEGEKSMVLVDELNVAQKGLIQESQKVEDTIRKISDSASNTVESLQRMNDTMNIINTGGKEINQFIAMIDDISDRINLLSLNAAIEAARAGEYGRGFAVVADEIGKLAQATSDNSKEISRKITKIISDIETGTLIVTGTKESTDVIFKMVNAIGSGVNSVRELMLKQNRALEMVIKQASVIDTMSRDIMTSTSEQKNSMTNTQTTIERLSEMAMEISQANSKIIDFTKIIHEKALDLDRVIRE